VELQNSSPYYAEAAVDAMKRLVEKSLLSGTSTPTNSSKAYSNLGTRREKTGCLQPKWSSAVNSDPSSPLTNLHLILDGGKSWNPKTGTGSWNSTEP
jgi:hypothetical protein